MRKILSSLVFIALGALLQAQERDCMLGLGGSNTETIIQVFQLNEDQIGKLKEWQAELSLTNKVYQEDIRILFDTHPQSSTKELEELANKYRVLKDQILLNARAYDIKMLKLFNPKQYERYIELCASADRIPYKVVPQPFPVKGPE
ncbi:DUF2226 domain-containing protein [Muriicola soli]|uniref:DUF2226 domain-containing protein n=1 Tax=Muriicola soli TaxID=2507538 RepID=A0A411EAH3_9FLAO|nr:DUF2226 domain-containing protein [Muriicola soli]QBA64669.1 DUF2226 domain-containing protein [Muriicola soli]